MKLFGKSWHFVERGLALIGEFGLVLMMAITVVSIAGRFLVGQAVPDAVTITQILMLFVVLAPLAYVQRQGKHVRVTLLGGNFKPLGKRLLNAFGSLVCLGAFGVVCWSLAAGALDAFERNDIYMGDFIIPSWPGRAFAAIAVGALAIRFLIDLIKPGDSQDEPLDDSPNPMF